ncbi:MAG: cytidylate kinase-like family protein, partial [Treponema sp.]|nr:cytidylate kinase-like family protein [Treponema sp.]
LLQCQHLVNKLIFEYKLNIEFLRAVMEDGVITLQGIADSSVLVERALKISSVEFPNYTIKSAISVVQDFKPYS